MKFKYKIKTYTAKKFVKTFLSLLFLFPIVSFAITDFSKLPNPLPHKIAHARDQDKKTFAQKIASHGGRVINIGQDYLISLPSKRLFADQSPRLLNKAYLILNSVVKYLKQYRKISVTITGHSAKYVSTVREKALTRARARAIAEYLSTQDIDSRFIFTAGAGSDKPIIIAQSGGDKSANSRIEIVFREAFT